MEDEVHQRLAYYIPSPTHSQSHSQPLITRLCMLPLYYKPMTKDFGQGYISGLPLLPSSLLYEDRTTFGVWKKPLTSCFVSESLDLCACSDPCSPGREESVCGEGLGLASCVSDPASKSTQVNRCDKPFSLHI